MKILTNKKYNELTENLDLYKKIVYAKDITIEKNNKKILKLSGKNDELIDKIIELTNDKNFYKRKCESINKELINTKKAKGGYNKQINQLHKVIDNLKIELEETNQKLEESMTDKYLVKKIPSGKRPKTIFTKINNSSVQSNIVKNMYKEG